jgi:carbon storage regulator CsrA
MHLFQRGVNESLVIGRDLVVTVLEIQPTCVRLGITDPNSFPEYWEETLYLVDDDEDGDAEAECYDSAEFAIAAW